MKAKSSRKASRSRRPSRRDVLLTLGAGLLVGGAIMLAQELGLGISDPTVLHVVMAAVWSISMMLGIVVMVLAFI